VNTALMSTRRADRGYRLAYREGEKNYCPGCAGTHWILGRASAECPRCETALPLVDARLDGVSIERRGKGGGKVS
jgi:hypothetical protein